MSSRRVVAAGSSSSQCDSSRTVTAHAPGASSTALAQQDPGLSTDLERSFSAWMQAPHNRDSGLSCGRGANAGHQTVSMLPGVELINSFVDGLAQSLRADAANANAGAANPTKGLSCRLPEHLLRTPEHFLHTGFASRSDRR